MVSVHPGPLHFLIFSGWCCCAKRWGRKYSDLLIRGLLETYFCCTAPGFQAVELRLQIAFSCFLRRTVASANCHAMVSDGRPPAWRHNMVRVGLRSVQQAIGSIS